MECNLECHYSQPLARLHTKTRQSEASQKLRAKMESEQIKLATTATLKAITKAMVNIKTLTDTNLTTEFRINNFERIAHHQKQTTNEILNNIKLRQNKSQQKNLVGSHTGSMTAPQNLQTPHQKDVIDLTMTQSQSPERETIFNSQKNGKQSNGNIHQQQYHNTTHSPLQGKHSHKHKSIYQIQPPTHLGTTIPNHLESHSHIRKP
jgi:hypothetical protein